MHLRPLILEERFAHRACKTLPPISPEEFYWLAGLLEGEGCFTLQRMNHASKKGVYAYPIIQVQMTDRDVLERVGRLLGTNSPTSHPKRPEQKHQWRVKVVGGRAIRWMRELYPLMGQRRQQRIYAIIAGLTDEYLDNLERLGKLY